jgi:PAS domain S-box-containing protein
MEILSFRAPTSGGHAVRFYDTDESLYAAVSEFLSPALRKGLPCLVIATDEHKKGIYDHLTEQGFEPAHVQFTDAQEALREIVPKDMPDPSRFERVIGSLLDRAGSPGPPYVYGEVVDLLFAEGREQAGLRLEEMWNELSAKRPFRLLCSYRNASVAESGWADAVSERHTSVMMSHEGAAGEEVARLERRVAELEREIAESQAFHERASAIVESSDDAIISKDVNGIITSWNRGAQRLYGYDASEVIGKSIAVLMPPDYTNDFPTILERLRRGERIEHYETVRVSKEGRRIQVSLTISPLKDASGRIIGASKIARDITERKQSEAALRQSEEKLAADLAEITRLHALSTRLLSPESFGSALEDVLDNAMHASGAGQGSIQIYEPASRSLEIVTQRGFQKDFVDFFCSVSADAGTACARALKTRKRVMIEDVELDREFAPHRDRARAAGFRAVQSTPLLSHDGRMLGMLSTHFAVPATLADRQERLLDIYARHAADVIERFHFERALQDADRRKDEFIAVLAHELRNPLAPVRNAAHYLKLKGLADPDVRQPLEMIDRQVNLMSRLIEDLLDVSRITRGVLELRRERVLLADLVEAAVEACRHEVDARRHVLRVDMPEEPIALYADRARLIQVLCNLITNAAKYSPPGGEIEIGARKTSKDLEISVRDKGVGIPPDKLTEIFDLFAQLDRGLERQGGGLGIGLTLARQIIELHQGTIEARSEGMGKGSEFVLHLPMLPARTPKRTTDPAQGTAIRRRVLVADDNRDAADSLALLLGRRHEVHRAYDGAMAFELASSIQPEVMLLDIGMPRMDGYEVARRVRGEPWGANVYLVALSGWGRDEDKRRAVEAGFDAHLVKPATPEALDRLLAGIALPTRKKRV